MDDRSFVDLPPFNGWLFVVYFTLHTGFRYMWVVMVSGLPVSALPVAALALAAYWLWILTRCMPDMWTIFSAWV